MSAQIKFLAATILLTGMIGLAGCSSNNEQANSATPTTAPTETAVTATSEPEVSPSTTPTETASAATTSLRRLIKMQPTLIRNIALNSLKNYLYLPKRKGARC